VNHSLPTRKLPERPDLGQLKRQAKELLEAFLAGENSAVAEVNRFYHDCDPTQFALHDAQLVLARSYGYDSWPKLKAYVDGVTVKYLMEAVRSGDLAAVRAILNVRPEIVNRSEAWNNEHTALHYAVLGRMPAMGRLLMEFGADPHAGISPHNDATTALTIATERGYDEIVAIIDEEEKRREGDRPTEDDLPPALRNASAQFDARLSRSMARRNFIVTRFGWCESMEPCPRRSFSSIRSSAESTDPTRWGGSTTNTWHFSPTPSQWRRTANPHRVAISARSSIAFRAH